MEEALIDAGVELLEVGIGAAGEGGSGKNKGCGCVIVVIIVLGIAAWLIWEYYKK